MGNQDSGTGELPAVQISEQEYLQVFVLGIAQTEDRAGGLVYPQATPALETDYSDISGTVETYSQLVHVRPAASTPG